MTELTIPHALLPADGRFGAGPSRLRPAQLDAVSAAWRSVAGTSHRQPPVKHVVERVRAGLRDLYSLPTNAEVVLGNGGSTTFFDVAALGLVRSRAAHGQFGEFGAKFAAVTQAAPFLDDSVIFDAPAGTTVVPTAVDGADVYAWPHNETSTGAAAPVIRPEGIGEALVVVDATSAAGGMTAAVGDTDVYFFAPQKNLGSDGGLWLALMSERACERAVEIKASGRWIPASLDVVTAIDNSRKNQTYNTPAVLTLLLLAEQIEWILGEGGLEWAAGRTRESSGLVYEWATARAEATPFVANPAERSPVVCTVDFDDTVDAAWVAATLRANGIVDVEPYRKLGRNQLRIATFVSIPPEDVVALLACLDYVLDHR